MAFNIFDIFDGARQYRSIKDKLLSNSRVYPAFRCRDREAEPALDRISEKFLYYLWAEQPLKGLVYRTADNRDIKLVSPGLWNSSPGPDFTKAKIYIGGELYNGDVEVHLYSSDWYRHKHHQDSNYNNVALHITLWNDDERPIRLNNKKEVPQLILSPILKERLGEIGKLLELDIALKQGAYFTSAGLCHSYLGQYPARDISLFLHGAGESRLLRKTEKLRSRLTKSGSDYNEVLYQDIMAALGYRHNQFSFQQLAESIRYKKIRQIIKNFPPDKKPLAVQSIFIAQSGLKPLVATGFDNTAKYYLKCLDEFAVLSEMFDKMELDWRIPGGRPANSPYRRMAGMSYLLAEESFSFSEIINALTNRPSDVRKKLIRLLSVPPIGFWATRSTFDARPFCNEYALIGRERVDEIILNVVIPLAFLYAQTEKNIALQESVFSLYRAYPKLMANYYTRFMKQRLFKSDSKLYSDTVINASAQQGLIEIFTDFCNKGYEGCEHCGLLEWFKK